MIKKPPHKISSTHSRIVWPTINISPKVCQCPLNRIVLVRVCLTECCCNLSECNRVMWCWRKMQKVDEIRRTKMKWWLSIPFCVSGMWDARLKTSCVPIAETTLCSIFLSWTKLLVLCKLMVCRRIRSVNITTFTVPEDGMTNPPLFFSCKRWKEESKSSGIVVVTRLHRHSSQFIRFITFFTTHPAI